MRPTGASSKASGQAEALPGMGAGSKKLIKDSMATECNTMGLLPNLSDIFIKVSRTKLPSYVSLQQIAKYHHSPLKIAMFL